MDFSVFLPGHWFDQSKPPEQLYRELILEAQLAEELDFRAVWLAEHHFNNYVAQPGPLQLAAMIADRTERLHIGIAVLVVTFHHPLRLAGELAQLDVLAKGRLEVAIGRGAFPWEAQQMGIHQTDQENRDYCKEHLLVLAKTLRARMQAVDHEGSHWKFSNVTIIPPTATSSSPRFWVAAQQPGSVPWAVACCLDAGLTPMIFCSQLRRPFALVRQMLDALKESLADAKQTSGVGNGGARIALNQMMHLAPSVDQARKEATAALYPLNRGIHNMVAAAGDARQYIRNGIVTEESSRCDPTEDELLDNVIIGDPETVVAQIHKYRECGVDDLSLHFNFGQPHELVTRSMRLFARSVLPLLR